MKKRLIFIILSALSLLLIILAVTRIMPRGLPKHIIQATGIIEATEVNLSSKIDERIKEIRFKEGDLIKKGDTAIILDAEKIKAKYAQAQAGLEVSKANLLNAQADVEKAKVKITDTRRDLDRMNKLLDRKLVSQNDKDKAQTNYDLAVADSNKALAQESLAGASIKESEAALVVAKTSLEDTAISSPISGVVTFKAFEPQEMAPAAATILTIIDTADVWVRVDVEETAVAKIKLNGPAYCLVDALPQEEFKGRVAEINSEGEFATQNDTKRGRQDIKTFRVKVKIDEPRGILKPGMTVTVRFIISG